MASEEEELVDTTEFLPDDVLAWIFAYVGVETLLDAVPLVCKRWSQLSKHPDTWRNIDLVVPPNAVVEKSGEYCLRIAKLAPCVRTIDLHLVDTLCPSVEALMQLLLKGNMTVRNLHTFPKCTRKMQVHIKNLLQKFSPTLRQIKLFYTNGDSQMGGSFYKGMNELLQIIAEAPRLTHLIVDFFMMDAVRQYTKVLGKGCAKLTHFDVMHYTTFHDPLVLDVLESKKNQLVYVGFDSDQSRRVSSVLKQCYGLVKCRLLPPDIFVIDKMTQLRAIELGLTVVGYDGPFNLNMHEYLKTSKVLANITSLTLWGRMNLFRVSILAKSAITTDLIAKKCKNLQVFKLVDTVLPDNLMSSLLVHFQKLEEIYFDSCSGVTDYHLDNLRSLPCMRVVGMTNLSVKTEEDRGFLRAAVEDLRISKPNAIVTLTCELSPYEESDYDEYGSEDEDDLYDGDDDNDFEFTYQDYLRNKYGDEISDMDLWALASSDEEM